jgi:protein-S-isoprenylcysteine O-methyltransferase Ste14
VSRLLVAAFAAAATLSAGHAASVTAAAFDAGGGAHCVLAAYAVLQALLVSSFAVLVALRGPVRRRNHGVPALVAVAAALISAALMHPPDLASAAGGQAIAGEVLSFGGTAWVLVAVSVLGRCFGILPEARGLVTRGPYRLIRHPVYLGELTAAAGLVLAAPSPRNLLLGAVLAAGQARRMLLEERELTANFPAYADYARATPRLVPRPRRRRPAATPISGSGSPSLPASS